MSARTRSVALMALAGAASVAHAQSAGDITNVGLTKVSAMMMWLGTDDTVYILDKAENNAEQIDGHPAYGAVWNIKSRTAEPFRVVSNPFCAAGFHLPNGAWVTFGGNAATTRNASQVTGIQDWNGSGPSPDYGVIDGRKAIRIVKPCDGSPSSWDASCQEDNTNQMSRLRWYATTEALADGSLIIIGGMVYGGYINRSDKWFSAPAERDYETQHGNAENTVEFFPPRPDVGDNGVIASAFLAKAGGLNTYAHAFLMPSGKLFMNANISSVLFDTYDFTETNLPDDPNGVVRVYPASAGVAMLPLTPANGYTPTILFCGGTNTVTDEEWGTYHSPLGNVWEKRASADCQRLAPEPLDKSAPAYEADDEMPDPRTMGQFVILPDGTLLMINGARMGTAGYTTDTPAIPNLADMPFYMSLATDPVLTPAIYNPDAPKGSRWSSTGMKASTIPRLYHSTALLLPDGSVMVAGSNPGADVVAKADNIPFPTTYDAEYVYPPYWGKSRPVLATDGTSEWPKTLAYGGDMWSVTVENEAGKYDGQGGRLGPNEAGEKAKIVLMRPGYTTHAMSMGQRYLQLNSTYQVSDDGTLTLSVSQLPPNANIFTPGPALIFLVVDGVPSVGTHVLVGSGAIGQQPVAAAAVLPANLASAKWNGSGSSGGSTGGNGSGGGGDDAAVSLRTGWGMAVGMVVSAVAAFWAF